MYCLCVNVYYTTATGCQPNCSWQIYHNTGKNWTRCVTSKLSVIWKQWCWNCLILLLNSWLTMLLGSLSYVFIVGSNDGYTMFRGRMDGYWPLTPFACLPFTSPPVRYRVPSHFNWTLPTVYHQNDMPVCRNVFRPTSFACLSGRAMVTLHRAIHGRSYKMFTTDVTP